MLVKTSRSAHRGSDGQGFLAALGQNLRLVGGAAAGVNFIQLGTPLGPSLAFGHMFSDQMAETSLAQEPDVHHAMYRSDNKSSHCKAPEKRVDQKSGQSMGKEGAGGTPNHGQVVAREYNPLGRA